jgi:hypothetical protein
LRSTTVFSLVKELYAPLGTGRELCDYDKAEPLLVGAVENLRIKLGDIHPHTKESFNNLIELYEAWDKPEKAKERRAKLPQTEAVEE